MRSIIPSNPRSGIAFTGLLLAALSLAAARPLWALPFYYSDDGIIHLLHLYALDHAIRQGIVYPRWLMDFAFGYGYPLFNFYPPFSTYLAEIFHLGLDFPIALRASLILIVFVAAFGAYALGRDLYDSQASGILTATAFIFFPYFFTDLYTRGATVELSAVAILPWTVWALRRLVREPDGSGVFFFATSLAAMILAHSLTALIAAPALGGLFLLEWLRCIKGRIQVLIRVATGGILGLGLSAFYWLPFLSDLSGVRMGIGVYGIMDAFQTNFLPLRQLVQFDFYYRYTSAPYPLGATSLLLAICGVVLAWVAHLKERATILYFGLVALVCAFGMTDGARGLWEMVSAANLIQFPWRLTLLIGLGVSIAVGSLPDALAVLYRAVPRWMVVIILGSALIASAAMRLDLQPLYLEPGSPTLGQLARFEAYGGFIGATTWGEYMPADVRSPSLLNFKPRVAAAAPDADIQLVDYSPQRRILNVSAAEPFTLTLRTLYNSAWRAQVDGNILATYPTTNMALVAATIPAGAHQVKIELLNDFSQNLSWSISAGNLIIYLVLLAIHRRARSVRWAIAALSALAAIFAIPAAEALVAGSTPIQPLQAPVSSSANLIGIRIQQAIWQYDRWHVQGDSTNLHLTAIWHIAQPTDEHLITWRWVDASGSVLATAAHLPRYGTGVAAGWIPNEIVQDEYDLPIESLASGNYLLQVSWDGKSFWPVSNINLTQTAVVDAPRVWEPVDARVGESMRLIGYRAPRSAHAGERIGVDLNWRADKIVNMDYTTFVQLLDSDGNAVARPRIDTVTGGGLASPFLWVPGELVTDSVEMNLPVDIPAGSYRIIVGMYHYPEMDRVNVLSESGQPVDDFVTLGELLVR